MDRRWRSQSSISIDDRESGKIRLNLDELLKTPPKSPFLIDNMSISISKTGLIFPSSSNSPSLFDFATNNKRQIFEEKSKISFLLYSLRFVPTLLVPVPVPGTEPCKHIPRTRYVVSGTYYTYQVYCIWYISCTRHRLASCILYIVPRSWDLDLLSGIWDDNGGTLAIFISDQAITVEHTESIRFGNR